MRIISKTRLRLFWESVEGKGAEGPLLAWHQHVSSRTINWRNWGDLRLSFGNADLVGDCVVFNIGGNKFRLITRIRYPSHKVFILKIMTHLEYDKGRGKEECGCFDPPPNKLDS